MIITLNSLSSRLLISTLFSSFSEAFVLFLYLEHIPLYFHFFHFLCTYFYILDRWVMFPDLGEVSYEDM